MLAGKGLSVGFLCRLTRVSWGRGGGRATEGEDGRKEVIEEAEKDARQEELIWEVTVSGHGTNDTFKGFHGIVWRKKTN